MEENNRVAKQAINRFLNENYANIDRKMKSREFKSFNEFTTSLFSFNSFCQSDCPRGPYHLLTSLISDFIIERLHEGSSVFISWLHSDLSLTSQLHEDQLQHLHTQLSDAKKTQRRERELAEGRLTQVQS